ncbi:aspartyl/asparaginyl beta-hydroxylase domain-containing protein [bacterium]|nr:aspartyl/asparaginyl beta-hydroxylase domain-containing protein [Rubripirellula sp.]MDB4353090.1 aspartyl/asparaginyl beta-hydroxylase domain-containing protein [bacterium]MDB4644629.1 aspartyl/asparaginyl beta-hydroxylase domain-containing protein [Rubripirellula sp.]
MEIKNKSNRKTSKSLVLLVGIGGFVIPLFIVLCCLFSSTFLIVFSCFWIASQLHQFGIREGFKRKGILSVFELYQDHGSQASKFIEALNEPKFVDPSELTFEKLVTENYVVMREEILDYVNRRGDTFISAYDNQLLSTTNSWTACSIMGWGLKTNSGFPTTERIMRQIGAVTCNVSRLPSKTDIKAHNGETNAFTRCHLPLVVPAPLPDAGMVVGGEQRSWVEGEILAFIDLNLHSAFNNTAKDRIVLIFDVMRPGLEDYRSSCCVRWLVFYTFAVFDESFDSLSINKRLVKVWRPIFHWIAKPPITLVLWVHYRWFCRKLPFWFRIHKNTGFYF